MLYEHASGITDEDLMTIKRAVLEKTTQLEDIISILIGSSFWRHKIEEEYVAEFEEKGKEFHERQEALSQGNTSDDYGKKSKQVMADFKDAKKALVLTKTREWLTPQQFQDLELAEVTTV